MIKIIPAALFFLSFFASLVSNAILRQISIKYNFLIDAPNDQRKFHHKKTPATGGIAISIGIIFSGLFLFAFTDSDYDLDISTEKFINSNQTEENSSTNSYSFELENGIEVKIQRFDDQSFTITLPDGEKRLYRVYVDQNSLKNDSYMVLEEGSENQIRITNFSLGLFLFTLLVQFVMVLDDLWGLRALTKLFLQSVCVGGLIFVSDMYINNLGNLFGFGDINLGLFGIPFTIFCVVGIMNAFNMIDGLNGICASLALIPLMYVTFLGKFSYGLLVPIGAIIGFLAYNLGFLGKKRGVFLGDSGSNMLGFAVAFICIEYSQNVNHPSYINPVTALWLVAIPLIDCVAVMISRALNGIMPFRSGRDHLHHKLLDLGFKPKKILIIFIATSALLALVGFAIEINFQNKEYISFFAFAALAFFYYLISKKSIQKNV